MAKTRCSKNRAQAHYSKSLPTRSYPMPGMVVSLRVNTWALGLTTGKPVNPGLQNPNKFWFPMQHSST